MLKYDRGGAEQLIPPRTEDREMIGFYNYTVILTYMGAVAGAAGLAFAAGGKTFPALLCLLFAGICDMFDGAVARTKKRTEAEKKFGIWIDSLTDMVCFAVLPTMIGWSYGMKEWYYIPIFAAFILGAIIRLGYYGVTEEERQTVETGKRAAYDGMPVTTSAAIFPVVWVILTCLGLKAEICTYVYAAVLALSAFAFVGKFKIKKPGKTGITVIAVLGAVLAAAMVLIKVL